MKIRITLLILVILPIYTFGQDVGTDLDMRNNPFIEATIEYKDGQQISGFLKLENPTNLKFKDSLNQKKPNKINYKSVKFIVTFTNDRYRTYTYKKTDRDKFLKFVEALNPTETSEISLFVYSQNTPSLFYQGIDRSNVRDYINETRKIGQLAQSKFRMNNNGNLEIIFLNNNLSNQFINDIETSDEIRDRISSVVTPKFLFGVTGEEELFNVFSKKRLIKFAENYLNNCPDLIEKIKSKELKSKDAPEIHEQYKECKRG